MNKTLPISDFKTHKEKRDFWFAHIDSWKSSSKSQRQYCNEYGLKLTTFGYWQKVHKSKKHEPIPFVKIKIKPNESRITSTKEHFIQVKLPNNIIAKIPLEMGIKEVVNLLQGLGGQHANIST